MEEERAMTQRRKTAKKSAEPQRPAREDRAGESPPRLEDRTRTELFEMARRLEIAAYTEMSKPELVEAIRRR
jgi:hypothetical protein